MRLVATKQEIIRKNNNNKQVCYDSLALYIKREEKWPLDPKSDLYSPYTGKKLLKTMPKYKKRYFTETIHYIIAKFKILKSCLV